MLGYKIGVHRFHPFRIYLLNYTHVRAFLAWVWQCLDRPAEGVRSGVGVTGYWLSRWLGQCCSNKQSMFSWLRITGVGFLFVCTCAVSWPELSCVLAEFCGVGGKAETSSGQPASPSKPPPAHSHWSMTPRGAAGPISGG